MLENRMNRAVGQVAVADEVPAPLDNADFNFLSNRILSAQELRKRCRMTSKTHYNTEELFYVAHAVLGGMCAVGAAVNVSDNPSPRTKVLLASVSATAAAVLTFLKPATVAAQHHTAGVEYGDLERRTRTWELRAVRIIDKQATGDVDVISNEFELLQDVKKGLDQNSPIAPEMVKWYTKRQSAGKPLDK